RHLERALKAQEVLDPDDKVRRCDLLLGLGEALLPAGESQQALDQTAAQALELAEALGDRARAFRTCRLAQGCIGQTGLMLATPDAGRWADLADRYAEGGTVDRVYADLFLGDFSRVGKGDEARARFFHLRAA